MTFYPLISFLVSISVQSIPSDMIHYHGSYIFKTMPAVDALQPYLDKTEFYFEYQKFTDRQQKANTQLFGTRVC